MATSAWSAPIRRFPFVPNRPERSTQDCYEAFNIQVQGLDAPVRGDQRRAHRHRRLRRARFDPCADRRGQGLRPARPAAHDHPRLHHARLRHLRGHQVQRLEADERARRHRRGDRHQARPRTQMLEDIGHPFADGEPVYDVTFENVQAGLRTDYLFRLANQRNGFVLGTGDLSRARARLVHLRRRRPDEPLRVNAGRAEDADPVPDPLGSRTDQFDAGDRRGPRGDPRHRDLARAGPGRRGRARCRAPRTGSGPTSCSDFFLLPHHALRPAAVEGRVPRLARLARRDARASGRSDFPRRTKHEYDLATIRKWLEVFLFRFFEISQFKRSAMPKAEGLGGRRAFAPRRLARAVGLTATAWLEELSRNVPG